MFCFKVMTLAQKFGNSLSKNVYLETEVIDYKDLRYLMVTHFGFDGLIHRGELIVHRELASEVVQIFKELYQIKFPIEKMCLMKKYQYSDEFSMMDNNSSAFNFRRITNGIGLSQHAFGVAIDINPLINPYIEEGVILPPNGGCFISRDKHTLGMIRKDGPAYKIFQKYGWTWGGDWEDIKDYHHFEKPFNKKPAKD